MTACLLACHKLDMTIAGRVLVRELELRLEAGDFVAVLGRNGAGKTTTLHTLAGLRRPAAGRVDVDGKPLQEWSRRDLAQRLGLLMQNYEHPFPSTVLASALIGRHPHIGVLAWENDSDEEIAREVLGEVGLGGFEDRQLGSLSGGELRRLNIATVLVQDPDILLLDEPANHLDLNHQLMILQLLADRAARGRQVLVSMHDVNLAMRFCDHALLLFGDGEWLYGASEEVIDASSLSRLYNTSVKSIKHDDRALFFAA